VDYLFYLFVLCAFLAVVLLFEGGFMLWNSYKGPEAKKIDQRLRALSAGEHGDASLLLLKERNLSEMPAMERLLLFVPRVHQLDRLLIQSGSSWTVARFFGISALIGFAGFAAAALLHLPGWLPLALGALGALLPLFYILRRRNQRLPCQVLAGALKDLHRQLGHGLAVDGEVAGFDALLLHELQVLLDAWMVAL